MRPSLPVALLLALLASAAGPVHLLAQELESRAARFTLGGRVQAQYAASSVAEADNDLFLRRARFTVDAVVSERLDGRIQPSFVGGSASLKDAWVRLTVSPAFRVSVGQFKRAFDIFELASSTDLSIIERDGRVEGVGGCAGVGGVCSWSRLTAGLEFSDRDQGVRIDGRSGRISWLATVTNGTGANTSDENDAKSFSGRLEVAVTEGWTVSGQAGLHDHVGPDGTNATAAAWSADVEYGGFRERLHIQAGVVGGENWRAREGAGPAPDFLAAQAVATAYLPLGSGDGLFAAAEPLVRVSVADPDRSAAENGGVVFTPGLMLYLGGKNKVGANLDVWTPSQGDTEYSLKLQTFLYF